MYYKESIPIYIYIYLTIRYRVKYNNFPSNIYTTIKNEIYILFNTL